MAPSGVLESIQSGELDRKSSMAPPQPRGWNWDSMSREGAVGAVGSLLSPSPPAAAGSLGGCEDKSIVRLCLCKHRCDVLQLIANIK